MITARTLDLPKHVQDCPEHRQLGKEMIKVWQEEGIFQIKLDTVVQKNIFKNTNIASHKFFDELSVEEKRKFVREDNYSGYTGSMEEVTGAYKDTPEVFTIFKDIPVEDLRCKNKWPLHGPVPWPSEEFKQAYTDYTNLILGKGNRVLQLISLGLGLENMNTLVDLTNDGCYNIRVMKYPKATDKFDVRGVGAHTDYGFLSLGNQDVEGLMIRPPIKGEKRGKNWIDYQSGRLDTEEGWQMVKAESDHITIYPGDMFQLLTNGFLLALPHRVVMNQNSTRYANAFFHEPNFNAVLYPLMGENKDDHFHFGTHITNMYLNNCPERITTKYFKRENQAEILKKVREQAYKDMSKKFIY